MSSNGGRAGAYRLTEQEQPRSSLYTVNRPSSVYTQFTGGSQHPQYPGPKSVITFEFYDSTTMADPVATAAAPQLMAQSSQQRRVVRSSSPKPSHHVSVGGGGSVGVKKLGGGAMKPLAQQRTTSTSPTVGHYQAGSRYFTITAYLPFDGGKRLKLHCTPGMTVQQVIETEIPDISRTGYQVYHFPSRALLNPEKDAGVLQDQEIWIEPMRLHNPGAVNDKRLVIVKELLRTEDMYLENLRNIFDVYMEPLRKWSLPQSDMNIMFRSLSRLCDLLMNFFSELEIAVQIWDTTRTLIGGLFKQYPSFWDLYDEYSLNYPRAIKLLKEKCRNEAFSRFLDMKRGAARHTLESLMLLPVQRIYEYHRLLVQLYTVTSKEHPDYEDLRHTVARVQHMVQSREHQLTQTENETKLDQVQQRFPNDNLFLSETLVAMEALTRRNKTSSPAGGRGHQKKNSMPNGMDQLEAVDAARRPVRAYLQEGPAKFINGLQSHDRYFFLFDDLLLIAKPTGRQRSQQRTFRLKHRLRLSELWVSEDSEPLLIAALRADSCLVIGWPTANNFVVQFSSDEEKNLWSGLLHKYCSAQLKLVQPDSLSITIINHTKSSNQLPAWMLVHCTEKTDDVLGRALEKRAIPMAQANCQLWVKFSKDEAAVALHGHEHPFAIQAHHNRQLEGYVGDQKPVQMEFYIKRKNTPSPVDPKGFGIQRKTKTSRLRDWYSRRRGQSAGGREHRGKRKKPRMFGAPLSSVIVDGQLPDILQEMLIILYNEGPKTLGIFRQSANYRKVKEVKEVINTRQRVDLSSEEMSIHVVGALLKDLLRSVPGGILHSSRYTEFVATNDIKDVDTRVHHIQRILQKLPSENQLFLHYLLPLLHHIAEQESTNCMNAINLAICFAPSLLWPDSGLDVIKNEVPPLIEFMIDQSPKIFNHELPDLYQHQSQGTLSPSPRSYRVPTKKTDGTMRVRHRRTGSMDTSTSEDSAGEDDYPSNLLHMQRSGLTVSDSQVSVLSQQLEDEEYTTAIIHGSSDIPFAVGHEGFHPPLNIHSPKRPKKSRAPERSSSYRGPNERPPYVQKYRPKQDEASRRKSIATQTTLQQSKTPHYTSSPHQPIPPSPNTSVSSSSHSQEVSPFIKSHHMQSFDENEEYLRDDDEDLMEVGRRLNPKRKRTSYRNAFSVDQASQNKERTPKVSYYDHLLPLSPMETADPLRSRTLSGASKDGFDTPMEEDEEERRWLQSSLNSGSTLHTTHPNLSSSSDKALPPVHTSNQSITSRSSTSSGGHYYSTTPQLPQSRPSNLSLVSSISESSYGSTINKGSPESERTPLSREMVKYEITKRFGIPARGNSFGSAASYSSGAPGRTDSFNQELDNIQRKFQERRRPEALHSTSTTGSRGLESVGVSSPPSFDDRPESERHLNSLPRPTAAEFARSPPPQVVPVAGYPHSSSSTVSRERRGQDSDLSKLYVECNSDTESSPSRTLTRREKLNELNSTLRGMPLRYRSGYPTVRQTSGTGRTTLGTPGRPSHQPPVNDISIVPVSKNDERTKADTEAKAALTQSLPPQPLAAPNTEEKETVSTEASIVRPKSAEGSGGDEAEMRKRIMSDVEMAKLKLGLIPTRRRTKSISESKLPKAVLSDSEEKQEPEPESESQDELEVNAEEEKPDRRDLWRAHAPNSSDRKEAWAQREMGGSSGGQEMQSRSAKNSVPNPLPALQRTATAPEMSSRRRAATMPEYLAMRTVGLGRSGRVLGKGLVRTVKITAYDVPEPRKIHRINLRTYH